MSDIFRVILEILKIAAITIPTLILVVICLALLFAAMTVFLNIIDHFRKRLNGDSPSPANNRTVPDEQFPSRPDSPGSFGNNPDGGPYR